MREREMERGKQVLMLFRVFSSRFFSFSPALLLCFLRKEREREKKESALPLKQPECKPVSPAVGLRHQGKRMKMEKKKKKRDGL